MFSLFSSRHNKVEKEKEKRRIRQHKKEKEKEEKEKSKRRKIIKSRRNEEKKKMIG